MMEGSRRSPPSHLNLVFDRSLLTNEHGRRDRCVLMPVHKYLAIA